MNKPVDIVVTYLNSQDSLWQEQFLKYQDEECFKGIAKRTDMQSFGADRFREWDLFKYWFRGVEKNCPWVNKIFLIVQNERHIPEWINKNNPKLRIVYHNEFIPNEILPVFNSRTIELFTCKIKDLSDHYIRCNDDCYFLNPIPQDMFFKDGKPCLPDNRRPLTYFDASGEGATFWQTLNNCLDLEKLYAKDKNYTYGLTHLQMACSKNFELEILNRHYNNIYKRQAYSRFRNKVQYNIVLYDHLIRLCNRAYIDNNMFKNSGYYNLKLNLNYDIIKTKQCVCLNDTNIANKNFEEIKKEINNFFETILPDKSSFEK